MSVAYRDSKEDIETFVDNQIDCTPVAWEYAELMYSEEEVEERRSDIEELIEEYSNPYSGELKRPDFFENVKPGIDELLSE